MVSAHSGAKCIRTGTQEELMDEALHIAVSLIPSCFTISGSSTACTLTLVRDLKNHHYKWLQGIVMISVQCILYNPQKMYELKCKNQKSHREAFQH